MRQFLLQEERTHAFAQHESDCTFVFDFAKVYWNSRLHTEHGRLVELFKPEDVVADVFAGVGPFAVPAGRKGCGVFANDLNPESFNFLELNIEKNNVCATSGRIAHVSPLADYQQVNALVRPSCEDGKDFIRAVIARALENPLPPPAPPMSKTQRLKALRQAKQNGQRRSPSPLLAERSRITQFVMNLPDTAILFLGAFRGVLSPASIGGRNLSGVYREMPMVHCYCFTREEEPEKAAADIRQVCACCIPQTIEDSFLLAFTSELNTSLRTPWATKFRTTMCGQSPPTRRCTASASGSHGQWPSKRRNLDPVEYLFSVYAGIFMLSVPWYCTLWDKS